MLKKRARVSYAPRRGDLKCSRFDIGIAVFRSRLELVADRDTSGQFCAQLRQMFNSVEKHADR